MGELGACACDTLAARVPNGKTIMGLKRNRTFLRLRRLKATSMF